MNVDIKQKQVGVLGATSFVGRCLLQQLVNEGGSVVAFSRHKISDQVNKIEWRELNSISCVNQQNAFVNEIALWICLAPITALSEYFTMLESYNARRIVVLSSTSRYTKENSPDSSEQLLALHFAEAEELVQAWAESRGVEWIILRPTLIYGDGQDRNVSEIARFIRRFGLFPLFDKGAGLRQPIHAHDVAKASWLALQASASVNRAYNISGAETLTYREMVVRIFSAMNKRPRLLSIPLWMFAVAVNIARCLPRYRKWNRSMAERMNRDMVFDHGEAQRDFGFKPRAFDLRSEDIPI